MAFDFIKEDELLTTFEDAKKFMLPLHEPIEEFERIARNRPHPGIAKDLPKVTDGTLASIIQEKPKRIIQQVPTGNIEAEDDWLELIAGYILENEILPNANEEAAFIQKCWAAVSKSMIYGSQPAFVRFLNRGDYFGTDFTLPYIKDVLLEPGKVSDRASNVMFLRTWWSKNQIEAVINKENDLSKRASDRGDDYDNGWNLERLQQLIEEGTSQKDVQAQSPQEKGKLLNAGFYEIVHVFQRGVGACFYSFSPKLPGDENLLRTKDNPDPRGVIPIHFLYADQNLSNPLGVGAVEMSGGVQNLLDSEMQMYQFNRALMLNPPMKKKGNYSKANIKFVPNHVIDLGQDGELDPLEIDSTALSNFPANTQLLQSQMMRLNQSGDTASISQDAGAYGMSKTPEGIKTRDAQLGVSDNHMRKQFESWFEEISETGVNLHFAERSGVQVLTLDDETAGKLRKLQPGAVNSKNEVRIDHDTETPKLKFKVDASSSNMKDNQAQTEAGTNLLELVGKFPQLDSKQGGPIDTIELADRIVMASGIEDPEKIIPAKKKDGQEPQQQQEQPQMQPEQIQQMVVQTVQQAMEAEKQKQPEEHPIAKVMSAFNLKGTDLDGDTLRTLVAGMLTDLGIQPPPPSAALPSEVDQSVKLHDAALKADDQAHQQQIEQANTLIKAAQVKNQAAKDSNQHHLSTADTALKLAQAGESANQAERSHGLAEQSQSFNEKQANKPQPKETVKNG